MPTTVPTGVADIGDTTYHDPDLRSHRAAVNLTAHLTHGWNVDPWIDVHEPGWGAARLVIGDHIDISIHGSADELAAVADRIHAAAAEIRSAER